MAVEARWIIGIGCTGCSECTRVCPVECIVGPKGRVHVIDQNPGDWFVGDVGDRQTLERFSRQVIEQSGRVDYLINNAPPPMKGIGD